MDTKKGNCGLFLGGFMFGAFLGALAGIFLAPKPGEELRSEVKEKGEKAWEGTRKCYTETRDKAKGIVDRVRSQRQREGAPSTESTEEIPWEA